MKLNQELSLTKDSPKKIFWKFAIPMLIAMIIQNSAQLIDSMFIGNFVGPNALSALTLGFPFVSILFGIGLMIAVGSSTLAGIELGKGNEKKSNNFFNISNVLSITLSIVATISVFIATPYIAKMISTDLAVQNYLLDYFQTISIFFFAFLMNIGLTFYLQLSGKPNLAVTFSIIGTVINITLDYLLIKSFGLGMTGAALATGISQLVPVILATFAIVKHTSFRFKWPTFKVKEIGSMLFNGSSEMLSMGAAAISGFTINAILMAHLGADGIASYTVALQLSSVASAFFYGLAGAIQSPVSVNIGAGQLDRVDKFRSYGHKATIVVGIFLCLASYFLGAQMATFFVKDVALIELAAQMLKLYAFAFLFMGFNIVNTTYYTSVNSPVLSGLVALMRSLIGLMVGLMVLPGLLGGDGVILSITFAEIATFVTGIILLKVRPYGPKYSTEIPHKQVA